MTTTALGGEREHGVSRWQVLRAKIRLRGRMAASAVNGWRVHPAAAGVTGIGFVSAGTAGICGWALGWSLTPFVLLLVAGVFLLRIDSRMH